MGGREEDGREGGRGRLEEGLRRGNDDVKQTQNLSYHFLGSTATDRQTKTDKHSNIPSLGLRTLVVIVRIHHLQHQAPVSLANLVLQI